MQFHYSNVCPRCQDGVWIWSAAKYVCCLRRGTFVLRRKKGTKERRKKPRFLDFLSAPRTFQVIGVRPTRLGAMQGASNVGSSLRAPSYRSPTCRPKRYPNPWFWRAFGYFSRAGKVTRQRHRHADSTTYPVPEQKSGGAIAPPLPYFFVIPPLPQRRPARAPPPSARAAAP